MPTKITIAKHENLERQWHVVDATDQPLGRLATRIAMILRGKHRPEFTPNMDNGDFVVVINASKTKLTGQKPEKKFFYHHSGIPGGFRAEAYRHLMERRPELVIEKAVWGMLPKNCLGRRVIKKLKVYPGGSHPHAAQKPKALSNKTG